MSRRSLLAIALVFASTLPGVAKPETWLKVKSQHFVVVTDAGEKVAKRVADQFERMRIAFQAAFPHLDMDPGSPIVVIAVRNQNDFWALEPAAYLGKGKLQIAGLFLRVPDKNYVLLRLDTEEEHPYAVIYHEYTHLLCSKSGDWLPLWLNEGLAQFFENTDIHDKEISSGQPSTGNLMLLRQNRLMPLPTLLTVDHDSPYYHDENKGSIFYAESWALTHYFEIQDRQKGTHRLADYIQLVANNVDSVTAATKAFGDLKQMQKTLDAYVAQPSFMQVSMKTPIDVDDSTFTVTTLNPPQAEAIRADFLAYNGRTDDARTMISEILKEDPKTAEAYETLGHMEFREGHFEEARKAYEQAVKLDSQSYLAQYYFAAISTHNGMPSAADEPAIEASFRAAMKLNPTFAPAFEGLATLFGMRHENLEEAHILAVTAVQLEPTNVEYRVTAGNILMQMHQTANAIIVYKNALKLAKDPVEAERTQNALENAERYQEMVEDAKADADATKNTPTLRMESRVETPAEVQVRSPQHSLKGPRHEAKGILENVQCSAPAQLEFNLAGQNRTIPFHSDNYYKVIFSVVGFTPEDELHPCTEIEKLHARVQFVDSATKGEPGQVVAVELSK
jgi:tetratricopeptide (TPR) repeat protein